MSRAVNIFIRGPKTLAEVARELNEIMGLSFQRVSCAGEEYFEARTPSGVFTLGFHEFENDGALTLEDYPFSLEVEAVGIADGDLQEARKLELGRIVFEHLRKSHDFDVLLVDNLQHKLDEYQRAADPAQ